VVLGAPTIGLLEVDKGEAQEPTHLVISRSPNSFQRKESNRIDAPLDRGRAG
jgi:hypothetical protein